MDLLQELLLLSTQDIQGDALSVLPQLVAIGPDDESADSSESVIYHVSILGSFKSQFRSNCWNPVGNRTIRSSALNSIEH